MNMTQKTTVSLVNQEQYGAGPFVFGNSYEDGTLNKVIDSLLAIRESIPPEYRDVARCEIRGTTFYDSEYATIDVTYERPETAEETDARETAARRRREAQEFNERQSLALLLAKYGPELR